MKMPSQPALFTVSREAHINHIIRLLPFLTFLFFGQCFLLKSFIQDMPIGPLSFMMGSILIGLVGFLYYYDISHSIEVHHNCIISDFPPFFSKQIISFKDIEDIEVADIDMDFSNVKIILTNGEHYSIFFIDSPKDFLNVVQNQMFNFENKNREISDTDAA